jgi:DNA-binding response OmpR family regulator
MRILVVEDDRKVASFLEQGLREDGYSVDVAWDGTEGALLAHVHDYDLLIHTMKGLGYLLSPKVPE